MTPTSRKPDHPIADLIRDRWSPRAFTDKAMTETEAMVLLEAARWAPSGSNIQPWRMAWGLRGDAGFAAIAAALAPSNRVWAEKAALLVVIGSRQVVDKPEGPAPNPTHAFDAGAAWMALALQARLSGWAAHAMGGFDAEAAARALQMPADHVLHAAVAVGEQGAADLLPESYRAREVPNGRNPVTAWAGRGRFVG